MASFFLEAALHYAALGWPVHPVAPGGKPPLLPGWPTVATTDRETVEKWWSRWPDANVGILTGAASGLVVVDVDPGRGGEAEPILAEYPTGRVVRTGSGGFHLYYRHPGGTVRNRVTREGLDVRGDGGFVVAPPSVHPSGGIYKWVEEGEPGDRLPPLVTQREAGNRKLDRTEWTTLLQGVGEGERHDAALRLAGRFAGKGVSEGETLEILRSWNPRNRPPLGSLPNDPADELERLVRDIYAKDRGRKRNDFRPSVGGVAELREALKHEVEWIIPGLLPRELLGLLVGLPGIGKTFLVVLLMLSVATGSPLFGYFPIPRRRRVLLVCAQDSLHNVARRVEWVAAGMGIDLDNLEGWFYHACRPGLRLTDPEHMAWLTETIHELGIELVSIDSYKYVSTGEENAARDVNDNLQALTRLQEETGVAILLVHHSRKPGQADAGIREVFTAAGSVEFPAWTNFAVHVGARRSGDPIQVVVELWDHPDGPTPFVLHWKRGTADDPDGKALMLVHEQVSDRFQLVLDPRFVEAEERILEYLRAHGPESKSMLAGTSPRTDKPKIGGATEANREALTNLVRRGEVLERKEGNALVHYLPEQLPETTGAGGSS